MAPSVPYVMFLKILIASCSLNSSWDQSYDYFCWLSSFEVENPSKSIDDFWRSSVAQTMDFNGFWWIPTSNEESATKILVTLVSGGVGRATDYQDLQKYPVGHARSHQNDARSTLDAPLSFFLLFEQTLPWGPTYHNPLMWGKFSLDFEKIMKIFRKKSEGDRKKKVFSEIVYFSSIICIRAPARPIRWSYHIAL